jgi:alanine racemase
MRHTSHIRVDLDAVAGNLRAIRDVVGSGPEICSVVKADAYGLGARRVARTLVGAGSRMLAVFTPAQAAEIEEVSGRARILVLMPTRELPRDPALSRLMASGRLELTVADEEQLTALAGIRLGRPLPVHLEIDTGMGRGGVAANDAVKLIKAIRGTRSLRLSGVFTHFSSLDPDRIREQAACFDAALEQARDVLPPRVLIHAASSGPCFSAPEQRRDLVRIGLGWTGCLPNDPDGSLAGRIGLTGAVSWTSSIVQVRDVAAGASVGYGSRWSSPRPTRLGLVPVGYADGYPSGLVDSKEPHRVLVETVDGPRIAPVVGAMNMDQLMIDLGGIESAGELLHRPVVLLSDHQDSQVGLAAIAARSGLVPHQLLACLGSSVPRIYLAEGGGSLASSSGRAVLPVGTSATAAG